MIIFKQQTHHHYQQIFIDFCKSQALRWNAYHLPMDFTFQLNFRVSVPTVREPQHPHHSPPPRSEWYQERLYIGRNYR